MIRMVVQSTVVLAVSAWMMGCAGHPAAAPQRAVAAEGDIRPAGARRPEFFREPGARAKETIFSPLDLPAPSLVRSASGVPGPGYWQQRVDYQIAATLDAEKKAIRGVEVITYTNNSPDELPYLWIHLEQNLFKQGSLGSLSVEPGTRFGHRGFDGGLTIEHVREAPAVAGGGEVGRDLHMAVYDTLGRVDLPRPVAARGGTVRLEIAWSFNIPPFGADRMGAENVAQGTIFEIAQWFPAAAVYDDVHGWNTLGYLGQGEFYTNFGDYDVKLTVPRGHIVAATGVLQNPDEVLTQAQRDRLERARGSKDPVVIIGRDEAAKAESRPEGDGPLTWHFVAEDVRTVAWASSPAFLWDACFEPGSGPTGPDGKPLGTLCQAMYPKEASPLWGRIGAEALRFSLEHYGEKWLRYPYPSAVNVNGIVGGMEYPMVVFCRERTSERGLFGVTTHEIGHNWFPMVINTDERRHGWMDEGFNTFINFYAGRARYPGEQGTGRGYARGYVGAMKQGQQQPMDTYPDHIWRGRMGGLIYEKTAVALVLLREQVMGPERFDAAFRRYCAQWAFKSPQPADFFRCMEDAGGMDLAWFWRGWFLETGTLDQAVTDVGFSEDGKSILATFTNLGELVMPADYRVTYTDGTVELMRLPVEVWTSTNQWTAMWDADGRTVRSIELDPEGVLPDTDTTNNTWTRR